MDGITFLRPEAFWLLPVAAAVLVLFGLWRWWRPRFAAVATGWLLGARPYRASRMRRLPRFIAAAALVAIVLALMEPVIPYAETRVESRGIDIVVVLDLSVSMEEMMGTTGTARSSVTRLEVTKRAISDFVRGRSGDRIGLVVFSENAYVVSPLSFDHDYVLRYVAMIDDQALRSEGLTAIGEGITVATGLLARQAALDGQRSHVILVLTDGENTYGRDPIEALDEAHRAGSRVHMVGVDLDEAIKNKAQVRRLVRRVEAHGGRYIVADTSGELREASRAVDSLEKGTLVSRRIVRNAPAFTPFARVALVLLCAALLLRSVPFFVERT